MLTAISGVKGRGKSGLSENRLAAFEEAVDRLEIDGGVAVRSRDVGHGRGITGFSHRIELDHCFLGLRTRPTLHACGETH